MAEFKFSCPQCGQHIQCDVGYAGTQITCPSCQKAIVVPQSPYSAAAAPASAGRPAYEAPPPPPPPPGAVPSIGTRQSTTVPASGQRFTGAPSLTGGPPAKPKSKALRNVLVITACIVVLAGLGAGGWFGFTKLKEHKAQSAKKGNPAAQVVAPTAAAAVQALSLLTKVHSAYTNLTTATEDGTVTLFLDLSNLTMADVNPGSPANARNPKNATRRPPGMPRTYTLTADYSVKRAQSNWFYVAGEATMKADRQAQTITFALWSADKGTFEFMDTHQGTASATYMQIADAGAVNTTSQQVTEQARNLQQLFSDPAQLTKIVKDLGQTADEPVNGKDCYTLTAKVLGQKVKIWVDKSTYLIAQSQITLGGAIGDADIDDAFSLVAIGITNVPPQQLGMIKSQLKPYAPIVTKVRGTITSITKKIEVNPTLTSDDFSYPVPKGVRLTQMPGVAQANAAGATSSLATRQRNTCINNLRQIDAAKVQWALEKGKPNGTPVTEDDIKPYLQGGVLPKCPVGGKYTIGKVGETPTCSTPGHVLP